MSESIQQVIQECTAQDTTGDGQHKPDGHSEQDSEHSGDGQQEPSSIMEEEDGGATLTVEHQLINTWCWLNIRVSLENIHRLL